MASPIMLIFLVLLISFSSSVTAFCETFASACAATSGWGVINGGSPITLSSRGSYYFYVSSIPIKNTSPLLASFSHFL